VNYLAYVRSGKNLCYNRGMGSENEIKKLKPGEFPASVLEMADPPQELYLEGILPNLNEFIYPFVNPERDEKDTDETWQEKIKYGEALKKYIEFLHEHSTLELFSNPRARSFYIKWLAQYGDDSIAQMAGAHLVFTGLSQVAIKHFEDQRIGLAPIEKSTRYVNYSQKINGRYLYYTDPSLKEFGLETEYCQMMDKLFATYTELIPKLNEWLLKKFPQEKPSVVEKKTFDTLRGLLPTSTLSQVAFFGNGQAFEHLINRSAQHSLGEIRWAAHRAWEELNQVTPSFLRRTEKETGQEYQKYLANKNIPPVRSEACGRSAICRPYANYRGGAYQRGSGRRILDSGDGTSVRCGHY